MNDSDLQALVDRSREEVVETRRFLHQRPELSLKECSTAALVAERCQALGFSTRTEVGGTGVVADLDSGKPGPMVMLRADMDALPIQERRSDAAKWISGNEGVMHACGHDGHVAIQLGVASILASSRGSWKGKLRLCFQPAEEIASGAQPMIDDGVLDGVDRALGLHLFTPIEAGRVAVKSGPIFGSADDFGITVQGKGGHGGMPHLSVDPIMVAAQIVTALQSLVSRETSPFAPAVVTIGKINGGTAFNVIAEEVKIRGTIRAFANDERERLLRRVAEIAAGVASAHRAEAVFEQGFGCPPVVSSVGSAELVREAAIGAVGEDHVDVASEVTAGDDMAYFLEHVDGCYYLVGAGFPGRDNAPHHHPEFDIDERSLEVGVGTMVRAALLSLEAPEK